MNTQPLKSKHRLLVLMDKSIASHNALKNAVNLAKLVDGSIDVLQVISPISVVRYENQIASMRAIDEERSKQKKELRNTVNTISKDAGLPIVCNFTFGNVKNEIKNHIEKTKPDIVVVGKRKKKIINFLGDQVTSDLLKTHDGGVLISGDTEAFTLYDNQSIGFLNSMEGIDKIALVNDLKNHSQKPFKLFKTVQNDSSKTEKNELDKIKELNAEKDVIVYEFDAHDESSNGMINFISKNNLSLLCINKKDKINNSFSRSVNKVLSNAMEKTDVSILVLNSN
jgi:nucleotide-binding universal stress UspA family protein